MAGDLMWLGLAWLLYFLLHSWLASLSLKHWVASHHPHWMPGYRLVFNLLALTLLVPPLLLTHGVDGSPLWQWTGAGWWLANALAVTALFGFVWSLRYYDGSEFLGLRQWRAGTTAVEDQERFHISPLHRFVRHPWYSLGLLLIWTRDMDPALLITAVLITLYFLVGSLLEERKLIAYHGPAYRHYRRLVPALFPLPWRYLTRAQARRLTLESGRRAERQTDR